MSMWRPEGWDAKKIVEELFVARDAPDFTVALVEAGADEGIKAVVKHIDDNWAHLTGGYGKNVFWHKLLQEVGLEEVEDGV